MDEQPGESSVHGASDGVGGVDAAISVDVHAVETEADDQGPDCSH